MNNLIPIKDEFDVYMTMARKAFESHFVKHLGSEAAVLNIMLMARELGVPPMQAIMGGMNIIQGKVEISPRLMNTMIRKAGHRMEITCSAEACTIKGTRNDTKEEYAASFNMAEARAAGLVKSNGPWEKYPSDMLFARCMSRLARRLFPDVIASSYVEGEIEVDITPRKEKLEPEVKRELVVQIEEKPSNLMGVDKFVETLLDRCGETGYTFLDMERYLQEINVAKGVPIETIMAQALSSSAMIERFCKAWQKWYDDTHPAE